MGMKFGRIVPGVNTHRLMESDFWFDAVSRWRHFTQKCAATWWMHTQHLCSSAQQFLINSTFVLVEFATVNMCSVTQTYQLFSCHYMAANYRH